MISYYLLIAPFIALPLIAPCAWKQMESANKQWSCLRRGVKDPTVGDWLLGGLFATLLSLAWPLVIIGFMGKNFLFRPPKHIREERQRERIKQLERELELQ